MSEFWVYGSMFTAALIAGTFLPFLPGSSEIVLAGLLANKQGDTMLLVASATAGNVLGAIVNYVVGYFVSELAGKKWFPANEAQLARASDHFERYGSWILLMSWAPFFGDLITAIAGLLRTDFRLFLVLVTIGKLARYVVLAMGVDLLNF
ncbi:YqaA family protein [Flaviflagellibacter deserti]|uniref:YqaA family protein n=1 Tax=Flaviflagellibacter deserti TaxID=2267266 RepID=A0ABV9YZ76_9HYPH